MQVPLALAMHSHGAPPPRVRPRTVLVASSDRSFRQRMQSTLSGLRWQVREAETGAEAWAQAENLMPEAVVVDAWLPDLELSEFLREFQASFPCVDVVTSEGSASGESVRSPYRQEILYALRASQDTDTAAQNTVLTMERAGRTFSETRKPPQGLLPETMEVKAGSGMERRTEMKEVLLIAHPPGGTREAPAAERIPELVGNADCMLEISRRIRLVAPRTTPVLIEGPTGSGKELVAEAVHRLSSRNRKPFVAINCAAIPEALLEAELFGHTRGAFTGAVQGRIGRIESADGGTLFLDEIGEMPLALQAKLLRFVECGELQRVGDNETVKVDVRVIAATHQPLAKHAQEGAFRSDLYYRLAVFVIRTPALAHHLEDLPLLVNHFLELMGRKEPMKRLGAGVMEKLNEHAWPGNVRELEHVLERAAILAGDATTITVSDIDFAAEV